MLKRCTDRRSTLGRQPAHRKFHCYNYFLRLGSNAFHRDSCNTLSSIHCSAGERLGFTSPTSRAHIGCALSCTTFFGYELVRRVGGRLEVSHDCHNPFCFNPAHVFLEPPVDNKSRQLCDGKVNLVGDDLVTSISDCNHDESSKVHRACRLPEKTFKIGQPNKSRSGHRVSVTNGRGENAS